MYRVPISKCPNCGESLDAASNISNENTPDPGDLSICLCGHLLVFADDLTLRDLNDAEMVRWAGDPALIKAQRFVAAYRAWDAKRRRQKRKRR